MYTIIVHNAQGASDEHKGRTKAVINAWLRSWRDPENLTVRVLNDAGEEIATKPRGVKRIIWPERRGRPLVGTEPRRAIEVTLMPSTIRKLRKRGGSVSNGIEQLVQLDEERLDALMPDDNQ